MQIERGLDYDKIYNGGRIMGVSNGLNVVSDSLIFSFDAGNVKCTDADNVVTTMRDSAIVPHSSRSDRAITGAGTTANITFPTDTGAIKTIDTGVTGRKSETDATNFDNRLGLDDDIVFADEDAWSCEFWAKPRSNAVITFNGLAGRGNTTNWLIWQMNDSTTWYPRFRDNDGVYRDSTITKTGLYDWHQVVFTVTTGRVLTFYVDGVICGDTITMADSALTINRLMAGYGSGTSRYNFMGSMLCTRIYDKTLSAAEILQNFNATRGRVGI
tara:strand:- start:438 stop:1250 length:813 start_codon:yes stop_codon:yes gene_type:complete